MLPDIIETAERTGISVEAYRRLCRLFFEVTAREIKELRVSVAAGCTGSVAILAHHIAGDAESLEFTELADAAWALERAAAEGAAAEGASTEMMAALFAALERRFRELHGELSSQV